MPKARNLLTAAPLALALALAGAAASQAQPPAGGPEVHVMRMGPGGPDMKAMHEAMMKQHMEDLKTVLRLRPDQEPALQAFLEAHRPPEMGMMEHGMGHDGPPPAPKSTPERLADEAKRDQAMAAQREKMRAALSKFYAALTPDQQKVFDALQRLGGGHGPGGPGMGPMMMGGMGGMMGGPQIRRIEIRRGGPEGHPPGHGPN